MTPWKHHLLLGDVWDDDSLNLTERRDAIVARIKASEWYDEDDLDGELWWIVDELSDAGDTMEFDAVWAGFYDWADAERVWVDLWKGPGE